MPKTVNSVGLVSTSVGRCPYFHRKASDIVYNMIEERFDFQIGEDGKIQIISLGKFDLVKEVNSHNGEVGLINCLKLAEARGLGLDQFAKTEPGLPLDLSDVETYDDLVNKQAEVDSKIDAIAKELGVTSEQLIEAIKTGDLSSIKPVESQEEVKEGE